MYRVIEKMQQRAEEKFSRYKVLAPTRLYAYLTPF